MHILLYIHEHVIYSDQQDWQCQVLCAASSAANTCTALHVSFSCGLTTVKEPLSHLKLFEFLFLCFCCLSVLFLGQVLRALDIPTLGQLRGIATGHVTRPLRGPKFRSIRYFKN